MTHKEKINELKGTITYLYEKEGRSKSYIASLIEVNRKDLSCAINEWELVKADVRHLCPSNKKFLEKNKKTITDMLDSDYSITEIADRLSISRKSLLCTYIKNDKELLHHYHQNKTRKINRSIKNAETAKETSARNYYTRDFDNEIWVDLIGYRGYQISNAGRIRKYANRYQSYYLLTTATNNSSGREYVSLVREDGTRKNLNVARLVAHAFVSGYSAENNTVDHKDGNPKNNNASNLEWVSQACNNKRAYTNGKKPNIAHAKHGKFKHILVNGKYEFKTIRALAKFIGVSETQAARYIDGECKSLYSFEIVN